MYVYIYTVYLINLALRLGSLCRDIYVESLTDQSRGKRPREVHALAIHAVRTFCFVQDAHEPF